MDSGTHNAATGKRFAQKTIHAVAKLNHRFEVEHMFHSEELLQRIHIIPRLRHIATIASIVYEYIPARGCQHVLDEIESFKKHVC